MYKQTYNKIRSSYMLPQDMLGNSNPLAGPIGMQCGNPIGNIIGKIIGNSIQNCHLKHFDVCRPSTIALNKLPQPK